MRLLKLRTGRDPGLGWVSPYVRKVKPTSARTATDHPPVAQRVAGYRAHWLGPLPGSSLNRCGLRSTARLAGRASWIRACSAPGSRHGAWAAGRCRSTRMSTLLDSLERTYPVLGLEDAIGSHAITATPSPTTSARPPKQSTAPTDLRTSVAEVGIQGERFVSRDATSTGLVTVAFLIGRARSLASAMV